MSRVQCPSCGGLGSLKRDGFCKNCDPDKTYRFGEKGNDGMVGGRSLLDRGYEIGESFVEKNTGFGCIQDKFGYER